jgi:hypothetical protein
LDVTKYLNKLYETRVEITMDGCSFLPTLHLTLLDLETEEPSSSSKPNKKSSTSLSNKALVFLLSHVEACPSVLFRSSILHALSLLSPKSPLKTTLQLSLLKSAKEDLEGVKKEDAEEYVRRLLTPFLVTSKKWIENKENGAFELVMKILGWSDESG